MYTIKLTQRNLNKRRNIKKIELVLKNIWLTFLRAASPFIPHLLKPLGLTQLRYNFVSNKFSK